MSHPIQVFVASDLPLEDFTLELETLLDGQLVKVPHETSRWTGYAGRAPGIYVELYEHEYENDDQAQLPFADYRFEISITGNILNSVEREQRLYEYARFVFAKLKEQNKYPIMLVDDMQVKLDEFTPR